MADGRYVFRDCVPEGDITIASVVQGEIVQREYSFRVNQPPDLQSLLDSGSFDPRNILTGTDGLLYDGDGNLLAEVNEWQAQVSFENIDYSPAGKKINWSIPDRYSVTLTFTETVVRDATLLQKVIDGIRDGQPSAVLNFVGVLRGHNAV